MKISRSMLVVLALAFAAPAFAAPPDHAPAHGYRAKHQYVYYREREIYYAPETSLWFWLDGGDWRVGAKLPIGYQQYTSGGVSVELYSDRPYTEHAYVVEKYGKGSKSKHTHSRHKKHHHHH